MYNIVTFTHKDKSMAQAVETLCDFMDAKELFELHCQIAAMHENNNKGDSK